MDVGENLGALLYGVYRPGEFIPTVKMKTKHPVEELFGNEFSSICLSLRSYGGLKSQDVEKLNIF